MMFIFRPLDAKIIGSIGNILGKEGVMRTSMSPTERHESY